MATMAGRAGRGMVEATLPIAESWQSDVVLHVHHDLAGPVDGGVLARLADGPPRTGDGR
jgi:hypothetical protein